MLIQAINGLFYRDPVIIGENWFVKFEEGPEVVVQKFKNTSRESALKRVRTAVPGCKILEKAYEGKVTFPPNWDKLLDSISYYVKLNEPIPIPEIYKGEPLSYPSSEMGYLAWKLDFNTLDVISLFMQKNVPKFLISFLFEEAIFSSEIEKFRQKARNKIKKNFPDVKFPTKIRNEDVGNWIEKLGERVEIKKL